MNNLSSLSKSQRLSRTRQAKTTSPDTTGEALPYQEAASLAATYRNAAQSQNTKRSYKSQFTQYSRWRANVDGGDPVDGNVDAITGYLAYLADRGFAYSTIAIAAAAIRAVHIEIGFPINDPASLITTTLTGISKKIGVRHENASKPLLPDMLRMMVPALDARATLKDERDAAIILLGFYGALRRSEIAALRFGDIDLKANRGMIVNIRKSKTDQSGAGDAVAIFAAPEDPDLCAVTAVSAWLKRRRAMPDIERQALKLAPDLPLFCPVGKADQPIVRHFSDKTIERIIKARAATSGIDNWQDVSPHSLRSGLATSASALGHNLQDIMRHTRHKSTKAAMAYIRTHQLWENNVTDNLLSDERKRHR